MSGGAKGIGLGIDFGIGNQYKRKGGKSYIDPAVLSSVVSVISTYGKTNEDADRSILKDKTGKGNDFKLLNFGFAENSGYGLYGANFNKWAKDTESNIDVNSNRFTINGSLKRTWVMWCTVKLPSLKIRISGINPNGYVLFQYNDNGSKILTFNKDGIYTLPSIEANSNGTGFLVNTLTLNWEGLVIEQLPDFEGWLCTDGVEDIIESVKPVSEMLEGSNEITVVSIIHQISFRGISSVPLTNYIRLSDAYIRNHVSDINKTGIYGYTCSNVKKSSSINTSVVNNILGDKNDYSVSSTADVSTAKFSVQGYIDASGKINELSQVAYAGGFISNKALTTDEINQIIAYFNLDRPGQIIKPQLYCNIKKQGITNDNHAEFNDQLIDFVGGHNIQLNNISWEGESGINSYPVIFGANKTWTTLRSNSNNANYEVTPNIIKVYKSDNAAAILYSYVYNNGISRSYNIPSFKLRITGLKEGQSMRYKYVSESDKTTVSVMTIVKDDTYDMPRSYPIEPNESTPNGSWIGFITDIKDDYNVTLEVFPTIENALCLDGISDFGKATGLPVLKDYTIVAERGISNNNPENFGLISDRERKNDIELNTFVFEKNQVPYAISFGMSTSVNRDDSLKISYQSKYSYNGESIVVGGTTGNNILLLGAGLINNDIIKEYVKAAVRFLMLFPYSLSEFLLERQLRKYKAGTLYPDMIEWRPIVKSNIKSYTISFYLIDNYGNQLSLLENGKYYDFSDKNRLSLVKGVIKLDNEYIDSISSVKANGIKVDINDGSFYFPVTKSPQKIDITIDRKEVLSNIKNSTWISNEQLIKNK